MYRVMRHEDEICTIDHLFDAMPKVDEIGETPWRSIWPAMFFIGLKIVAQEHEVTDDPVVTFFGIDRNCYVSRAVPWGGDDGDTIKHLLLTGDQLEFATIELWGAARFWMVIGAPVGRDGILREFIFNIARIIFGFVELFHIEAVIPMQVGKDDRFDLICFDPQFFDLFMDGRAGILLAVMMKFLRDLSTAHACIHQVFMTAAFQEPGEDRMMEDRTKPITKGRVEAFIQVLPAGENGFDCVCDFHCFPLI